MTLRHPPTDRAALSIGDTTTRTDAPTVAAPAATRQTVRSPNQTVSVFAHRGASGFRPEHTLAAYELAIELGADYIEPDLVSTKDGVLVARHENEISGTTDIAHRPEFAERRTTKVIDGLSVGGWFTEDLTLRELKTLRAKERLPAIRPGNTRYDGRYEVPTFDEILDLASRESRRRGRTIGVAPETKHPTYFRSIDLPLEQALLHELRRHGRDSATSKIVIQSFETSNLKALFARTQVPLMQLTSGRGAPYDLIAKGDPRTYDDLLSPQGLREIARYADWVGAAKDSLISRDAEGFLTAQTPVIKHAHQAGLMVAAYTFRDENQFLPADFRDGRLPHAKGDVLGELRTFVNAGVDGVFSDFPDSARESLR